MPGKNEITAAPPIAPATTSAMAARDVRVGYGEKIILSDLSLEINRGEITALCGPNGSGKSTLLKGMARLLKLHKGRVYLGDDEISKLPNVEIARRLGVLPQAPVAPAGLTVGELVEQGRYPHTGPMRMLRKQDHEAISRALELTGTLEFVNRPLESLSGGERQRAWIALTLAQSTPILFLDEPTTFLDIGHQLEVLELVEQLNRKQGMTIVMVLHDLNQAARYAHRMVVLRKGEIVADGAPADVLTAPILEKVFNVKAHILQDPETGTPVCLPYGVVTPSAPENKTAR